MQIEEYKMGRVFMGRLPKGEDLLKSIEKVARDNDIKVGSVNVIGAVEKAVVSYYDQEERRYKSKPFERPLEITACMGNISLKDGDVKAHIHLVLGDRDGTTVSGHLEEGTVIFASEIVMQELIGPELHRKQDNATGLPLWDM